MFTTAVPSGATVTVPTGTDPGCATIVRVESGASPVAVPDNVDVPPGDLTNDTAKCRSDDGAKPKGDAEGSRTGAGARGEPAPPVATAGAIVEVVVAPAVVIAAGIVVEGAAAVGVPGGTVFGDAAGAVVVVADGRELVVDVDVEVVDVDVVVVVEGAVVVVWGAVVVVAGAVVVVVGGVSM